MRAETILDAGALFDKHGWSTRNEPTSPFPDLFENYCRMLGRLDDDERSLVLALTKAYRWISAQERSQKLLDSVDKLIAAISSISSIRQVIMTPLKKSPTLGSKSSDVIFYMAREYEDNIRRRLHPRRLVFCGNISALKSQVKPGAALVLVDDYVGSGDTTQECIDELPPLPAGVKIYAFALAAHHAGVAQLAKTGCIVIASEVLHRGINDNSILTDKAAAVSVMQRLEEKLSVKSEFRFGWKATEGLITLARTPNNTFPIFWIDKRLRGGHWVPPFPRRG